MPSDPPFLAAVDAAALPLYLVTAQDWPAFLEGRPAATRRAAEAVGYRAQPGKVFHLAGTDCVMAGAVLGLGQAEKATPMLLGAAAAQLPTTHWRIEAAPAGLDRTQLAIAWALGGYFFNRYKPRSRPAPLLSPPEGADMAEARRVAEAVYLVRDLVNTPANDMGPEALQAAAEDLAKRFNAKLEVVVGDELLTQNFPLIHAVGRAAQQAPRLVRFSWGRSGPKLAIVGKGVCFDSGGLNLKTGSGMALMKKDMGGAAHALGLAQLIMAAKLKVRLEVYLPIVENAVSAGAFRPGDVLASRKGLTVEIDNTDAEGRLILADALALAMEKSPDLVIDFATLTGAARVALGPELAPFYTDDEVLAADLAAAAREAHDPLWRMPLWDNYDQEIESNLADIKNGADGGAGSITAALFLRRFVSTKAWAHFDIYAWSPKERPAKPHGGEATALRAVWRMLQNRYGA